MACVRRLSDADQSAILERAREGKLRTNLVLERAREETVRSFMRKTIGRNHWQQLPFRADAGTSAGPAPWAEDRLWDEIFPNLTPSEIEELLVAADDDSARGGTRSAGVGAEGLVERDKARAIMAYWELYRAVTHELQARYPANVRIFDMCSALNDSSTQEELLHFCGCTEPALRIGVHHNVGSNA